MFIDFRDTRETIEKMSRFRGLWQASVNATKKGKFFQFIINNNVSLFSFFFVGVYFLVLPNCYFTEFSQGHCIMELFA